MNWFETVNRYYNMGLWTIDQVKVAVQKEKITADEYKEIIGEDYLI